MQPTEDIIRSIYAEVGAAPPHADEVAPYSELTSSSSPAGRQTQALLGTPRQAEDESPYSLARRDGPAGTEAPPKGDAVEDPASLYAVPHKERAAKYSRSRSATVALRVPAAVVYSSLFQGGESDHAKAGHAQQPEDIYATVVTTRRSARSINFSEEAPPLPSRAYQKEAMHAPSILVQLNVDGEQETGIGPRGKHISTSDLVGSEKKALSLGTQP